MKTPNHEASRSTKPKRAMSPAVARSATRTQARLELPETSNFRPSRYHSNNTDSGSMRHFDMSEMCPQPSSERHRGPKCVLSLDGTRPDDDSSIDSTNPANSAPSHLPTSQPQQGQRDPKQGQPTKFWPPDGPRLMAVIKTALEWCPENRIAPVFDFRMSTSAAHANLTTLHKANFDLQGLLMLDESSPTRPGSEFQPVHILEPMFEGHPLWTRM